MIGCGVVGGRGVNIFFSSKFIENYQEKQVLVNSSSNSLVMISLSLISNID